MAWRWSPIVRSRRAASRTTRRWPDRQEIPQDRGAGLPALAGAAERRCNSAHLEDRTAVGKHRYLRLRTVRRRDAGDLSDGQRRKPADRFRLRAEMGLRRSCLRRLAAADRNWIKKRTRGRYCPLCSGGYIATLIEYGETTAVHTPGHCGIGDRPSVSGGGGPGIRRSASVRSDGHRADRGRYRFAGGCCAGSKSSRASRTDRAASGLLRPLFEIPDGRSAAPTTSPAAGSATQAAAEAGGRATAVPAVTTSGAGSGATAAGLPGTAGSGARSFD